jgi:hypothetical protein
MQGFPATIIADGTTCLHSFQEFMPDKGIAIASQAVPVISANGTDIAGLFKGEIEAIHI